MTRRFSDQDGFTLPELMMALAIGTIVMLASLSVLDGATRRNDAIQRRSGGIIEGRRAMDEMVRTLRSQVCVRPNENTLLYSVAAATGTSVTLYADFSDGTSLPRKHTISLATNGNLTDAEVPAVGTAANFAYTGTQTTRTIAQRIAETGTAPLFQYFAFNTATPATPTQALNSVASPTVAAADIPRIARIVVTLQAKPEGIANAKLNTTVQDEVFVRLADPDDAAPSPKCA